MNSRFPASPTGAWRVVAALGTLVGGALLAGTAIAHATAAEGCVGPEQCAIQPMRTMPPLVAAAGAAAILLLVLGMLGLAALARRAGGRRSLVRAGVVALTGGCAVLAAAVIQGLLYDGGFPWMPLFVGPGVLAVLAGIALVAASVPASVVPRWASVLVAVGAAAALAANEQNATILFVVPLGGGAALLGAMLCVSARPRRSARPPASARQPVAG